MCHVALNISAEVAVATSISLASSRRYRNSLIHSYSCNPNPMVNQPIVLCFGLESGRDNVIVGGGDGTVAVVNNTLNKVRKQANMHVYTYTF